MTGIRDLLEAKGLKKSDIKNEMEKAGVPFSYANHETFYNLINGATRPRDPFIYIYFAALLEVTTEEIIMRYSEVDNDQHEVVKALGLEFE